MNIYSYKFSDELSCVGVSCNCFVKKSLDKFHVIETSNFYYVFAFSCVSLTEGSLLTLF